MGKREYEKVQRQKRCSAGESISNRPEHIDKREEFGHWEMDSVIGSRGKSKNTLVVLTERKTRQELVFKVKDHSSKSVVEVLDNLERRWGEKFKQVFKTITVDNGTEFSDYEGLTGDEMWNRIKDKLQCGSIILSHNGTKHTAYSLDMIIKNIRSQGFEITTVSDLIYKDNYIINNNGIQIKN